MTCVGLERSPQREVDCILTSGVSGGSEKVIGTLAGERVTSLRTLTQRITLAGSCQITGTPATPYAWTMTFPAYPPGRVTYAPLLSYFGSGTVGQNFPNALNLNTSTATPYLLGALPFHPIGWFRQAFVGMRGGVNVKIIDRNLAQTTIYPQQHRVQSWTSIFDFADFGTTSIYNTSATFGPTIHGDANVPVFEFYVPYQSDQYFQSAYKRPATADGTLKEFRLVWMFRGRPSDSYLYYTGGSADFSFLRYRCLPFMTAPSGGVTLLIADGGDGGSGVDGLSRPLPPTPASPTEDTFPVEEGFPSFDVLPPTDII